MGVTHAAGTVIDAASGGPIFTITGGNLFFFDNLTLENGKSAGSGGALPSALPETIVFLTSSVIRNCSAPSGNGGAILVRNGSHVLLIGSTIDNCSAVQGGAVANQDGSSLFLTNDRIFNCSAQEGGAVFDNHGSLSFILNSAISGSSASGKGGAIFHDHGNTLTLVSSSISGSSAGGGGGVYAGNTSAFAMVFSNISDCSAGYGGAAYIVDQSRLIMADSSILNCSAATSGGALYVYNSGDIITISSTTFTNCSASNGYGGAIFDTSSSALNVSTSSITSCSALDGSAIYTNSSQGMLNYTRMYKNTGTAVTVSNGTLDARYNWWGSNTGPGARITGTGLYAPWLVLSAEAIPSSIYLGNSGIIRANLTHDSDGLHHDPADPSHPWHVPNGIPVAFSLITGSGSLAPLTGNIISGNATTTFFPAAAMTSRVNATIDGESIGVLINVMPVTTHGGGGSDDDSPPPPGPYGVTAPVIKEPPAGALSTVSVNVGNIGTPGIVRVDVTGVDVKDLVVVVAEVSGPGAGGSPPPGAVFRYADITPSRFGSIREAAIHFAVPQAWMEEHNFDPVNVVLYHFTGEAWDALPTAPGSTLNGQVSFTAKSPGFSRFAITGTYGPAPVQPVQETISTISGAAAGSVTSPANPGIGPSHPAATTPGAMPAVVAEPAIPAAVLQAGVVAVLIAGASYLVRRWWIWRQNPALFREYR